MMKKIFPGLEKVINDKNINLDEFKKHIKLDTSNKLGQNFIDQLITKNNFIPQFNIHVSTRTILINNDELYLELELLEPGHAEQVFVSNNNCNQAVGVLKGVGQLNIFSIPNIENNTASLTKQEELLSGDVREFKNSYFNIANLSDKPLLLLYITARKSLNQGSTIKAYNISTSKFSHLIASNLSSSRLETMISIMGELKYKACSDIVCKLSQEHPDYFVRWESIRTYLRVNPEQAIPFLNEVLSKESHPHVINAARKSLDIISRNNNAK